MLPYFAQNEKFKYYILDADLLHGMMQMTSLVELDITGVEIPKPLQQHLKV